MEYQVPQFIEIEDKIVGPLTLKQFIYLAGSAGIVVVCFIYLPIYIAVLIAIPFAGLGAALSFYKMNGKPFIEILEAGFNYYVHSKLFLWKHEDFVATPASDKADAAAALAAAKPVRAAPRLTRGKLEELAWSLDVKKTTARSSSDS